MHRIRSLACCLLLLLPAFAAASLSTGAPVSAPVQADDAVALRAHNERVRASLLARKGAFEDVDAERAAALRVQLDLVITLLEGVQRTTDLPATKQADLVNALASIHALVTAVEDSRVVCERGRRTGSNLRFTVCKTVAERREERRLAEEGFKADHQCTDAWNSGACKN